MERGYDDPAVILYSGGTTGTTKGIVLTNGNFNVLAQQIIATNPMFRPGDRMLAAMPLFHGFGLGVCVHSMLANGGRCILIPRFTAKSYAKQIVKYKCNFIAGVPTLYEALLRLMQGRDCFVLTTNVDHRFQTAGFDKARLFYTQGDYGLLQCSVPCRKKTYDNEALIREMLARQKDMKVPSELVPRCPVCGRPMSVNLRSDDTFVEDEGWHAACARYERFLKEHAHSRVLYLELGVGMNTPGIIKYPFWQRTYRNKNARYACISLEGAYAPAEIADRSLCISADLNVLCETEG